MSNNNSNMSSRNNNFSNRRQVATLCVTDGEKFPPQPLPPGDVAVQKAARRRLQDAGDVDREEMYRVFNMGIGYVLAVRPTFADSVLKQLEREGEASHVIGRIERGQGRMRWDNE